MKNFRVDFVREGVSVEVREGATILDAQRAAGLIPNAPCGGQGTCGKCSVRMEGRLVSACQTTICGNMEVDTEPQTERTEAQILMQGSRRRVTLAAPGVLPECAGSPLLAAVDLGTTSLVAYLMDARTGEELSVRSMLNPQRQYGADVVARCSCALENGPELLSSCVREAVNTLLRETALECGRSREDIVRVVMAGNTCMHHLFLNIPTDTLVVAPYKAKVTEPVRKLASECGIQTHPSAELWWLPNIGGFVGADTMACILACRMTERERITLMVDIGTNGEMVLGDRRGLSACSTAAGPAFEGAFGNYLNSDSACATGLLPAELRERIRAVGNAAGEGAQIAALNRKEYEKSADLARRVEFLELALDPEFQEIYVEKMEFPKWQEGDGTE